MKRALESESKANEMIRDINSVGDSKILCVGLLCLDIVSYVPKFIDEDSDQRCTKQTWERGGNASNNASVLAQLGAPVEFFGVMAQDHLLTFFQNDMTTYGILHSHCPVLPNYKAPASVVISSVETGSRTIIHNNGGLPEITLDDFKEKIVLDEYSWIHFEGRNVNGVPGIVEHIEEYNRTQSPSQSQCDVDAQHNLQINYAFESKNLNFQAKRIPVSIEVEKVKRNLEPLLRYADVAFVGKEFAQSHGATNFIEAARIVSKLCRPGTVVICPWGEIGASYCIVQDDDDKGKMPVMTVAAINPGVVVDSLGAGDTFDASVIFGLANGLEIDDAVRLGCKVAGGKLGTFGFSHIGQLAANIDEFKQIQMKQLAPNQTQS